MNKISKFLFTTFCCSLLLGTVSAFAQYSADDVTGVWYTKGKESKVKVFKCGDHYCGKLIWLEEPKNEDGSIKRDTENPDPEKRDRKIKGLTILEGLEFTGESAWEDGEIYDPESGKTYSCYVELQSNSELEVRGYIGVSWAGRSQMWTRAE